MSMPPNFQKLTYGTILAGIISGFVAVWSWPPSNRPTLAMYAELWEGLLEREMPFAGYYVPVTNMIPVWTNTLWTVSPDYVTNEYNAARAGTYNVITTNAYTIWEPDNYTYGTNTFRYWVGGATNTGHWTNYVRDSGTTNYVAVTNWSVLYYVAPPSGFGYSYPGYSWQSVAGRKIKFHLVEPVITNGWTNYVSSETYTNDDYFLTEETYTGDGTPFPSVVGTPALEITPILYGLSSNTLPSALQMAILFQETKNVLTRYIEKENPTNAWADPIMWTVTNMFHTLNIGDGTNLFTNESNTWYTTNEIHLYMVSSVVAGVTNWTTNTVVVTVTNAIAGPFQVHTTELYEVYRVLACLSQTVATVTWTGAVSRNWYHNYSGGYSNYNNRGDMSMGGAVEPGMQAYPQGDHPPWGPYPDGVVRYLTNSTPGEPAWYGEGPPEVTTYTWSTWRDAMGLVHEGPPNTDFAAPSFSFTGTEWAGAGGDYSGGMLQQHYIVESPDTGYPYESWRLAEARLSSYGSMSATKSYPTVMLPDMAAGVEAAVALDYILNFSSGCASTNNIHAAWTTTNNVSLSAVTFTGTITNMVVASGGMVDLEAVAGNGPDASALSAMIAYTVTNYDVYDPSIYAPTFTYNGITWDSHVLLSGGQTNVSPTIDQTISIGQTRGRVHWKFTRCVP